MPQAEFNKLQPDDFEDILVFAPEIRPLETRSGIESLITAGEGAELEFKSSLRWDAREGKVNSVLEKVVVKTVAGFLNSGKGGKLLIGVDDNGHILGLDDDYKTLGKKPNRDGFELHLGNLFMNAYGKDAMAFIEVKFQMAAGEELCEVTVKPAARAVFVNDDKGQQFFVRANSQTIPFRMEEMLSYSRVRWG